MTCVVLTHSDLFSYFGSNDVSQLLKAVTVNEYKHNGVGYNLLKYEDFVHFVNELLTMKALTNSPKIHPFVRPLMNGPVSQFAELVTSSPNIMSNGIDLKI